MINSQLYVDDPDHDLWMLEERLDSEDRGDFVESMLIMVLLILKMGRNNRVGRLLEGYLLKWKETMTTISMTIPNRAMLIRLLTGHQVIFWDTLTP